MMQERGVLLMHVLLDVPYQEKDLAKKRGARWNPQLKSWYVDDLTKVGAVSEWIGNDNIVCENLYILTKEHTCWKCGRNLDVVLLATDNSCSVDDGYQRNQNLQILTYVKRMPQGLEEYMKQLLYYPEYSVRAKTRYFLNHCSACKSSQGDNFLHEVPKQSFYSRLCYRSEPPIRYARIQNTRCVRLQANLPYYDELCSSMELLMHHMRTGSENRASMRVSQKLINKLFQCSTKEEDIYIPGL